MRVNLSGLSILPRNLKSLRNLKNLRVLRSLKNLGNLKNLRHLKPLNILKHLKRLRHLTLNLKHFKGFKNLKSFKHLKHLKNFKNLTILLLLNLMIVSAIYPIFKHQFKAISSPALVQKIIQEKTLIDDLKQQLNNRSKRNQTADKFNLSKQARLLRIMISAFDNVKINAFESNHKGLVYAISGESTTLVLLAYKLNKAISNNRIKAQLKSVLINKGAAVLKVQVFGVNVDDVWGQP